MNIPARTGVLGAMHATARNRDWTQPVGALRLDPSNHPNDPTLPFPQDSVDPRDTDTGRNTSRGGAGGGLRPDEAKKPPEHQLVDRGGGRGQPDQQTRSMPHVVPARFLDHILRARFLGAIFFAHDFVGSRFARAISGGHVTFCKHNFLGSIHPSTHRSRSRHAGWRYPILTRGWERILGFGGFSTR